MGTPLSRDLRERILAAVDLEEESYPLIADRFLVSVTSVERLVRRRRLGLSIEPGKSTGRPRKFDSEHLEWVGKELRENPYITSYELSARFKKYFPKTKAHRSTVLRAVHDLGFSFKKNSIRSSS